MGLLKDLNFKNRNGVLVTPDSEKLGGETLSTIKQSFNSPILVEDVDSATKTTTLPKVITQQVGQNDWVQYQVTANNLTGNLLVNGITQTVLTSPVTNKSDFFGDNSNIATYLFDGTANDARGTYNGTATSVTYAVSGLGQCVVFSGASDASRIALKSWDGVGDFSISLWVSKDRALIGEAIFGRYSPSYSTGGDFFGLLTEADGTWGFTNEYGKGLYVGASGSTADDKITLNTWTHLIVTITGATVSLYTNGKLSAQSTSTNWATGARVKSTSSLYLGQPYVPDASTAHNMFKGKIDNVRIFNRGVNQTEATSLYNEGLTIFKEQMGSTNSLNITTTGTAANVNVKTWKLQ